MINTDNSVVPAAQNDTEADREESTTPLSPVQSVDNSGMQEVNNASQNDVNPESFDNTTDLSDKQQTKSPLKRNVTFPGEELVSGYLDPPDPWKDAPPWTSADLINSYKASCRRHNAKPLNGILNQLQGIENVGERYAILSLKGEKLDMKNVETLEEIFKLVQFQCVDLEGTHLDEETSVAIFEMIEYYGSACKVNISFNKGISMRGWQACARMVRKTPELTFLDARSCDINERLLPIMGRALRMGCFLKILHLENTNLSGRPLVILVAALKMNEILRELFLADNKLMPSDGIQIGSLLKYNHVLELLDLRNNHLQDIGTGHICDGIYEQNLGQGLNTLVLWNNSLGYLSMLAMTKALSSTRSLETLNIGHNNITNEGIHALKDGLLQNKSLLRLGLQGIKVTCEGAVALAEVIADNPRFVRIDLRENEIKTAGLMALSLALKVNNILQRLDLDKDTKRESGIKDYADQQKRLQQEINKKLEENREAFYKLEQERKENKNKVVQNIENEEEENSMSYLENSVKRPSVLIMPECHPEVTLDSPHSVEPVDYIPFSAPVISTPPGELLLSPQYCPSVKAKKLFTVSKVCSSPMKPKAPVPSILPPALELPMALPSSLPVVPVQPIIINPNSDGDHAVVDPLTVKGLTDALVSETVNQILNQITLDVCNGDGDTSVINDNGEGDTSVINDNGEGDTSVINDNDNGKGDTSVNNINDTDNKTEDDHQTCDSSEVTSSDTNNSIDTSNQDALVETPAQKLNGAEVVETNGDLSLCTDDKPSEGNVDKDLVVNDPQCDSDTKDSTPHQIEIHIDSTGEGKSPDIDSVGHNVITNGYDNSTSLTVSSSQSNNNGTTNKETDSGVGSYDCEQWTSVEDTNKPNFQTSLTLNGLTQELASAIEGLDVTSDVSKSCNGLSTGNTELTNETKGSSYSSPDDFEKELDAMLADVNKGSNIFPGLTTTDSLTDTPLP